MINDYLQNWLWVFLSMMLGKSPPASHKHRLPVSRIIHPDVWHHPPPHSLWFGRVSSLVLGSHSPKHTIELKCFSIKAPHPDNPMQPVWSKTSAMHVRQPLSHSLAAFHLPTLIIFRGSCSHTGNMADVPTPPLGSPWFQHALGSHELPASIPSFVLRA